MNYLTAILYQNIFCLGEVVTREVLTLCEPLPCGSLFITFSLAQGHFPEVQLYLQTKIFDSVCIRNRTSQYCRLET